MTKTVQSNLKRLYRKYRATKKNKRGLLGLLRVFMPEIVFRTTRLEGERVTRRMISALFK